MFMKLLITYIIHSHAHVGSVNSLLVYGKWLAINRYKAFHIDICIVSSLEMKQRPMGLKDCVPSLVRVRKENLKISFEESHPKH